MNEKLELIRENLARSQDLTDRMVNTMNGFGEKVSAVENLMRPIHSKSTDLDRAHDNIDKTINVMEAVLEKFKAPIKVKEELTKGGGIKQQAYDNYLQSVDKIKECASFFTTHKDYKSAPDMMHVLKDVTMRAVTDMEEEYQRRFSRECKAVSLRALLNDEAEQDSIVIMTPVAIDDLHKLGARLSSLNQVKYIKILRDARAAQLEKHLMQLDPAHVLSRELERHSSSAGSAYTKLVHCYYRLVKAERDLVYRLLPEAHFDTVFAALVEPSLKLLLSSVNMGSYKHSTDRIFVVLNILEGLVPKIKEYNSVINTQNGPNNQFFNHFGSKFAVEVESSLSALQKWVVDNPVKNVPKDGGVHEITITCVHYLVRLLPSKDTLAKFLPKVESAGIEAADGPSGPFGHFAVKVLESLQVNLEAKARSLRGNALQTVFLLNNHHHAYSKIKTSELANLVGNAFLRQYNRIISREIDNYKRYTWEKVIDNILDSNQPMFSIKKGEAMNKTQRHAIKAKFNGFNATFEDVYFAQRGWSVNDNNLRTLLRNTSLELILPVYEKFLEMYDGTNFCHNLSKYLKYPAPMIKSMIEKFFSGVEESAAERQAREEESGEATSRQPSESVASSAVSSAVSSAPHSARPSSALPSTSPPGRSPAGSLAHQGAEKPSSRPSTSK